MAPDASFPPSTHPGQAQRLWRDPVLLGAFLISGGLLSYQLIVTLLQPAWIDPVTDWLRTVLAWAGVLVVLLVSRWLTRTHRPEARSWWWVSAGMGCYLVAETLLTVEGNLILHHPVPFPSLADLFLVFQYLCFFLALILLPGERRWESRLKLLLDCLLVMGAATALSFSFLLVPLTLHRGASPSGKLVLLSYPVGDLVLLLGLTVLLIYRRRQIARATLALLIVAFLCLFAADSWVAWHSVSPSYRTGSLPNLLWMACYLLVPLAGLVLFRLTRRTRAPQGTQEAEAPDEERSRRQDLKEVFQLLFPFVAALLASAAIGVWAIIAPVRPLSPLISGLEILGLLLLVIVRQGITVLEQAHLRRERDVARTNELAVREANRQMETFLGIASHELKTPLTSIMMGLQRIHRRLQRLLPSLAGAAEDAALQVEVVQALAKTTLQQSGRLNRLVNDLLDTSLIQAGRLELRLKAADLAALVRTAVEEQRQAAPERTIFLHLQSLSSVPVCADAERIGQVMTNYLSNALKYSGEGSLVEVGVLAEDQQGRVWVRDQGPGIPQSEQDRLWQRFHRVAGIEVQSGSGIGLGIGLYLSKTIIEQHGGQVGVQSAPGHGSMFWFTLPLAVVGQGDKARAGLEPGPGKSAPCTDEPGRS